MDSKIVNFTENVILKELQIFSNLAVYPLIYKNGNKLSYYCLDDAITQKWVEIKEISEGGSVPELMFVNHSEKLILLIDGEELVGAKQNRILNTSILVDKNSSLKIPVSCVEAGRWGYNTPNFQSSNRISPGSLKMKKNFSVSMNLRESKGNSFRSDQHEVWSEVDRVAFSANVMSSTRALSDIYEDKKNDISAYVDAFKTVPEQNGMLVFINGSLIGIEYISNENIFSKLFPKLIRGYAMDAIIDIKEIANDKLNEKANEFIRKISDCSDEKFKSVGLGDDHRINLSTLNGSALCYEDELVHLTVFNRQGFDSNTESNVRSRNYIRRTNRF